MDNLPLNDPDYQMQKTSLALASLGVYRQLLQDPVVAALRQLLGCLSRNPWDTEAFLQYYNELLQGLLSSPTPFLSGYLLNAVIYTDNPYAHALASGSHPHPLLTQAAAHDLDALQMAAGLTPAKIKETASGRCPTSCEAQVIWDLPEWLSEEIESDSGGHPPATLKAAFSSAENWSQALPALAEFHANRGSGYLARFIAFTWERNATGGYLRGIPAPDPIRLDDLIGYEEEHRVVVENTLQFLSGYPANNMLLYGDSGTGKSSTVKALLNEYHQKGLRLIELPKALLADFPAVIRRVRNLRQRFIIFVDDLVFAENEESYTSLKAVLEGGVETRPENVLIYATSNRRHLIRERCSDRSGLATGNYDDELRSADTMQEKLSLSDRFGITVIFPSPDEQQYLQIAEGIAQKRGLTVDRNLLRKEALRWKLWQNGCSPRTARQFVDWLEGHLAQFSTADSK